MLSGWMGVSPKLRIEVTFLMTFSSVNPMKVGDGHNMKAVEQAGECLFSDHDCMIAAACSQLHS